MNTKKLINLMLSLVMVLSMTAPLTVTAFAGTAVGLAPEAACSECSDAKHAYIVAVDSSNVTFTLYDTDGSITENQSLPVSYFADSPAVGEWFYSYTMYYGKCAGEHGASQKNDCRLDLDSTTTDIPEKKELDQNYNLTVKDGEKPF